MVPTEHDIRSRLGIPDDAEKVLIFTESAHWDPDWLLTSRGYFRLRVRRNLDQAIAGLIEEPRRVYSAECAFFMRMYWEHRPERQATIRDLVNSGRLRLMGSGVTTPDTLIPSTEALLRDYLVGQEWYRAHGMNVEPEVAYFPDSFGHTPAMPSIMREVGVTGVAVCRIDGQLFLGCETELPRKFPRPGTSAELLMKKERTQDFVWRGPDGAEILAHWVAYGYGQGELLAHAGATRVAGAPLAVPWRSDTHVARRIARYTKQLSRNARTPYMLCPIGFDFSAPIPRLLELLDRYNAGHYPETGTWVVNAGLDDYLALVGHHRDKLPVIDFDPNPYFSGFYTSRATIKQRSRLLVDALLATEARAIATGLDKEEARVREELAAPWWVATTSNHHDFITGTAPDRVVRKEQLPWVEDSLRHVARVAAGIRSTLSEPAAHRSASVPNVEWKRKGTRIEVEAPWGKVVFDEEAGGAIVSVTATDGTPLTGSGPVFDVATYEDTGGLWRMGLEYAGGVFGLRERASDKPAMLSVTELEGVGIEVASACELDGTRLARWVRIYVDPAPDGSMFISLRAEYTVPDDRTVTILVPIVPIVQSATEIVTDVPGGVARRLARNFFDPTFWNVQSFAHVAEPDGSGTAVFLGLPGAVALREGAQPSLEIVLARNANKERFHRVLPIPGFPARGHDPGPHAVDIALVSTASGDWRRNGLVRRADRFVRATRRRDEGAPFASPHFSFWPDQVFTTDRDDVAVLACKPADRGEGVIVRLFSTAGTAVPVGLQWPGTPLKSATLCDARERDLRALNVDGDTVAVPMDYGIASVRLLS